MKKYVLFFWGVIIHTVYIYIHMHYTMLSYVHIGDICCHVTSCSDAGGQHEGQHGREDGSEGEKPAVIDGRNDGDRRSFVSYP